MSKKNRSSRNSGLETIHLEDGTVLEQFRAFTKNDDSPENIVRFLGVKNAELMIVTGVHDGVVPDELEKELAEFWEYFSGTGLEEKTRAARLKNWPNDAFTIRLAYSFAFEREVATRKAFLDNIAPQIKKEAQALMETIWEIRKNRTLTFAYDEMGACLYLHHRIARDDLDYLKDLLLEHCARLIILGGGLTVMTEDRNGVNEIFGIAANGTLHVWKPISRYQMLYAHTHMPDGTECEPEKDVVYTEIGRKIF